MRYAIRKNRICDMRNAICDSHIAYRIYAMPTYARHAFFISYISLYLLKYSGCTIILANTFQASHIEKKFAIIDKGGKWPDCNKIEYYRL